jgi:putative membrane protein
MTSMIARSIQFVALAAIVAACAGKSDETPAADTTAPAAVSAAPEPTLNDPTIVAIFDGANTADVETGELAAQRGSSKEVRDFGAMLARDHKAVRQQGRDLAQKLGVTPTPPANDASAKAHADAMTNLQSKSGVDFDKAFLDHEVQFHQSVIDAVNSTLMPAIQNAELKGLVTKVAPAFEAHRAAAANLRQKLGS